MRRIGDHLYGSNDICVSVDNTTGEQHLFDIGHSAQEFRQALANSQYQMWDLRDFVPKPLGVCVVATAVAVWGATVAKNWPWIVLCVLYGSVYPLLLLFIYALTVWTVRLRVWWALSHTCRAVAAMQWAVFVLFLTLPATVQFEKSMPGLFWTMFCLNFVVSYAMSGLASAVTSHTNARNYCNAYHLVAQKLESHSHEVHEENEKHLQALIASNIANSSVPPAVLLKHHKPRRQLGAGMQELLTYMPY